MALTRSQKIGKDMIFVMLIGFTAMWIYWFCVQLE